MDSQGWITELVQSLEDASDIDRQRRAWVDRLEPNFPTPIELVCQLFDDTGIDDLLAKGDVFSEATDSMLRRLSSLAADLDLNVPLETLLSSEGWVGFAHEAARVLSLVREDLAK